ncbi:MAG: Ldh family oxidoreductase [Planctomycetes bacterium]|nr:Ldh family oxidoreductase [Planctomycetota bacterium]
MNQNQPPQAGIRVRYPAMVAAIDRALAAVGVPAAVRAVEAELMAEADLMGTASHGIRQLPRLLHAIKSGGVRANPNLRLTREFAATCVLEGDYGPGRYVSLQAMNHAVERARKFGIGSCLATNTSHWGRAHAYAYRAALAGMIGICTTNAMVSILAFGSDRPLLSNNPLGIGVPRGDGQDPVVLDMAMSQAAVGKVETYRREGKKAPLDWGLDSDGKPTDDPAAILTSHRFLPTGGHKGAGLALMMEMLTGVLAGGTLCYEMGKKDPSGADAHASKIFIALNPAAFGDPARFSQRAEDLLNHIHGGGPPGEDLFYPGERGWRNRDKYLVEGVPLDPQTVRDLAVNGVVFEGDALQG